MPAKPLMTWEPRPRRWRKMHRGVVYTVSCEALGVPETKESSYQAANAWWQRRRAETEADRPPHPHNDVLTELEERLSWARRHHAADDAARIAEQIEAVGRMADAPTAEVEEVFLDKGQIRGRIELARRFGVDVPDGLPAVVRDMIFGDRLVWEDRTQIDIDEPKIPEDRTVAAAVDRYLAMKRAEAESGQIRVTSYQPIRDRLPHFKNYVGDVDAGKIDERTLSGFHAHLLDRMGSGDFSQQYAAHILSAARSFVRHLWRERTLEALPRNLDTLAIKVDGREIETFDLGALDTILDAAVERTRLYLLLMLNCGMYQSDVAAVKQSQVDWAGGKITRKRTKTEREKKVPTVSYLLWDETFRLLKKYRSQDPILALTNENGAALLRRPLRENGRVSRTDNIKKGYERLCKCLRIEEPMPLMYLRKTSASLLETHETFGRHAQYFLGQAPQSLAERRYAKPSPEQFDRAVRWLGLEYGYVTTR